MVMWSKTCALGLVFAKRDTNFHPNFVRCSVAWDILKVGVSGRLGRKELRKGREIVRKEKITEQLTF